MSDIEKLLGLIDGADRIVFFGGAGVSTESGIPDFRSEAGLYNAKKVFGRSPEGIISHTFFLHDPDTFFHYYKTQMIFPGAEPNDAHKALAKLEASGKNIKIVTQNIDGLHQMAGSKEVYELHGSIHRNYCIKCGAKYDLDYVLDEKNCVDPDGETTYVPYCSL
ncbi:MAG: NAD-dependent protein deacylase, partial [Clostridiales Family XIII bacterium]|nr:NAD-dependent protein deacylase [Clostridiales Family XIII bacterium]